MWNLYAVNVRTNHVHSVVSIGVKGPGAALNAFKSNATRSMREARLYQRDRTPWADKGSERWIWTEKQLTDVIDYVLYCQGDDFLRDE
jgi:REP element-mobilizing transposase RayT